MLHNLYEGASGVMVTIVGNRHGDSSSNPGRGCFISLRANTHGKAMNPTIPPPAMGTIVMQTGHFNCCMATNLRKGKL